MNTQTPSTRTKNFKNHQDGFTLVEVILTIMVFAIGTMGALAISQNMLNSSINGDFRVMAGQLASEKLEEVIADKNFQGYSYIDTTNYPSESLSGDFAQFTRATSIEEVDPSDFTTPMANSGMKRVSVSVSWTYNSETKNVTVTTLLSEHS